MTVYDVGGSPKPLRVHRNSRHQTAMLAAAVICRSCKSNCFLCQLSGQLAAWAYLLALGHYRQSLIPCLSAF